MNRFFESAEVPFTTHYVGSDERKCLTDAQLFGDHELNEFVIRFADCFKYDELCRLWVYDEPDRALRRKT